MHALIITKPSNLEQHGAMVHRQIAKGFIMPSYLELLERSHEEHYQCLANLRNALQREKITFSELSRTQPIENIDHYDAVFAIGGDGTSLFASHHICNDQLPLIGLKSSSTSVGHLCAGDGNDVDRIVELFLAGKLPFIQRARLMGQIIRLERDQIDFSVPCLNDFLFTNIHPAATTRYHLQFADQTEIQKSSGIWIATATGSSAGISAAGGSIVKETETDFQFIVREPFTHTRSTLQLTHGFFNPEKNPLSIINQSDVAILALDGARLQFTINIGDRINFLRAPALKLASNISETTPEIANN
jgi:NAD+ kinase